MIKPSSALEFLRICGRLKGLKRTGWVNNQVQSPESVADHMYRMSMCCMLIEEENTKVDRTRCIKLAIVHDLAESLAGDITPHDGVSAEDKHQMERDALEMICATLGASAVVDEIKSLWLEYEAAETAEAQLVKDFDKFEMILQADEYERAQGLDLQDFFASTCGKFRTPLVQKWEQELLSQRQVEEPKKTK